MDKKKRGQVKILLVGETFPHMSPLRLRNKHKWGKRERPESMRVLGQKRSWETVTVLSGNNRGPFFPAPTKNLETLRSKSEVAKMKVGAREGRGTRGQSGSFKRKWFLHAGVLMRT